MGGKMSPEYHAAWRAKNAERKKEADRQYYQANKEGIKARLRAARAADPEKARAQDRQRYLDNKEKISQKNLRYVLKNRERVRAYIKRWHKDNKEAQRPKRNAAYNRRRARILDSRSPGCSAEQWLVILEEADCRCVYCGISNTEVGLQRDHIIPISRGGLDEPGNVVPACPRCNRAKWHRTPSEWLGNCLPRIKRAP